MCDFKPGDEVEKFRHFGDDPASPLRTPPIGHRGVVTAAEGIWIEIDTWPTDPNWGLTASEWRRVQRKNTDLSIEAFLTIKPGFEEPRRVSEPKRERVS